MALKVAFGFGAGMGRTDGVCGAVSGACMVIGLRPYDQVTNPERKKEMTYLLVKDFVGRFANINRSVKCTELLRFNLSKPEEFQAARDQNIFSSSCPKFVSDAVLILEDMPLK
jgi:C_GCAxxG_C_C family probable redox protein